MFQGGQNGGIRVVGGAPQAEAGGQVTVECTKGSVVVASVEGDPGSAKSYPVGPDGKVTVAVPDAPGEVLVIRPKNNLDVTVELPIVNLL